MRAIKRSELQAIITNEIGTLTPSMMLRILDALNRIPLPANEQTLAEMAARIEP